MPLYNSNENDLLSSLEETYRDMIQEGGDPLDKQRAMNQAGRRGLQRGGAKPQEDDNAARRARLKQKFGKRIGGDADEEEVKLKKEPEKKKYDAEPKTIKRLKTRHKRKGEGL